MANRAFRRMVEHRRLYSSYPMDLPGEYVPEPEVEQLQDIKAEEERERTEIKPVHLQSWNPEKEILDNLRSVWYNFKNAENEGERNGYLQTIDKILSK